jgi:hypothetical protein
VPAVSTQVEARAAFGRWGLPLRTRVDNGSPWGSTGELPTDLALWLIGLGVDVLWNPPRCPQANGVVERSQGTGKRWADPLTCRDVQELRRRLQEQDAIQRERYPSIRGRSRMEAFPALLHSGRPYRPAEEAARWDLGRVLDHLSGYVLVRRVDRSGTISLYNRNRYIGKALKGLDVYVSLDPIEVEWVYSDGRGTCYRRQKAEELTAERVQRMEVSHHRERSQPPRRKSSAQLPEEPRCA